MKTVNIYYDDYLCHYGVKGMKWGVRHDEERSYKKQRKKEQYRQKLISKSRKKANKYNAKADEYQRQYDDMKKHGVASKTWKEEVARRTGEAIDSQKNISGKLVGGALTYAGYRYSDRQMQYHMVDVKKNLEYNRRVANDWMRNNNKLMNMKVNSHTKKREIRKAYVGRRLNRIPDFD